LGSIYLLVFLILFFLILEKTCDGFTKHFLNSKPMDVNYLPEVFLCYYTELLDNIAISKNISDSENDKIIIKIIFISQYYLINSTIDNDKNKEIQNGIM